MGIRGGHGGAGGVLEVQLASMREMDTMSRELAEICEGEPEEILKALASRESLLKEIGERQGVIERDGGGVMRDEIEALAVVVHQRDEKTLGTILARRDEIMAELKSVDRSREAIRAYGPGERDRRRYRDDSA